ncbi:lipase [Rhizoctonia solani AG-1 IA]|uniref:triacylglycerol lipase n=1 Tax=Thanatephorus cucumeris (strain AG1-IA) TaxID=983506 RepID=L8X0Q6_THACA|nr:lipase [Rhizoctonia solani AG-1 IA]
MLSKSLLTLLVSLSIPTTSLARDAQLFTLRHVHRTHSESGHIKWADVSQDTIRASEIGEETLDGSSTHTHSLHVQRMSVHRPVSQDAFQAARAHSRRRRKEKSVLGRFSLDREWGQSLGWNEDDVDGPAIDKRETVLALAKMTNNAYLSPEESGWYDLGGNWTADHNIGWEPDADGFRGHVFLSADNATAILSIKGTSAGLLGGGGPTVRKDKLNDNLMFSCCCAHVDWTWSTVCGCFGGGNKCDEDCVEDALTDESLFYPVGINLYNNLTYMYPNAKIWVIGHSLGGALASLIGTTFGAPTVAFEAPGERMAAQRLHLPMPPSTQHITHIYHTADPIAMGTCNGITSSCYLGGYAMESRCHLGQSIIYDTVTELHWSADIRTHGIVVVIEQLLAADWSEQTGKSNNKKGWWGRKPQALLQSSTHRRLSEDIGTSLEDRVEVPTPKPEDDCVECYIWEFGDYMNDTIRK